MALVCAFTVLGAAKPQGSTRTRTFYDTHGRLQTAITHSNRDSLMQWRADIRSAVQLHAPSLRHALVRGPVACRAVFYRTRPPSVPKRKAFATTAPDLDKLIRAVGDALEKTVLVNDAQIAHWDTWKLYTDGASRLELEIWEADPVMVPVATVNPFEQPPLF